MSDNKETDYKVSLKKLKDLFSAHGYTAKAFSLDYSSLMNAVRKYPPVIARYDEGDGHFVLVLSGDDNKVIISNPSTGTNAMYSADFKKIFSGKTLLVHSEEKTLKTEVLNQMIAETERRIEFLENLERFLP
ncbi:MAG: cysteine peptidase family C39 domain-containing protein [Sphaerochaetaceae bacterium]